LLRNRSRRLIGSSGSSLAGRDDWRFRDASCRPKRQKQSLPRIPFGAKIGGFLSQDSLHGAGPDSMKIRKAVITAAGEHHSNLPLQSVVDREGRPGTALHRTLDEVVEAGIDQIAVVVRPGQADRYLSAAGSHASRLVFFEQDNPRGYGDAILRATEFSNNEPILHLVSDHLYVSAGQQSCAAQLCEVAAAHECSISAIQPTRENEIIYFGTVGGRPVAQQDRLYEVTTVVEKPTPTVAEQELIVAGQRSGHYLCLFGMHVFTPALLRILGSNLLAATDGQSIDLSTSLNELAQAERYLAFEVAGSRFNIGYKYGLMLAQLAISLGGVDRDVILTELVGLMAHK
jgi:UTP--glucose-1-phosphate uridylyltransferase